MKYKIARTTTHESLEITVNNLLKEGWRLQGGIHTSIYETRINIHETFYQAMTKEEYLEVTNSKEN